MFRISSLEILYKKERFNIRFSCGLFFLSLLFTELQLPVYYVVQLLVN